MTVLGKNVPILRFNEFNGKWESKKVGELCDFIVPGRNKPTNFTGDIPWITTPDILHNGIINSSKRGLVISKVEAKKIGSKIVPPNSVVISCVGDLGLVAITIREVVINQQLHAFIPKEAINHKFLLYALSIQKRYMDRVATKTALPYMNKDNCNSIPVTFPSISEQQKIASFLSSIDQKIQLLTRKKELLEQYKKGVMHQLFSGELRFKDEKGMEYPQWQERLYGEVYSFYSTNSLSREYLNYEHGNIKNIHYGDIHTKFSTSFDIADEQVPYINAKVDVSKIKAENYVQEGDLVVADASEDYVDIGKSIEVKCLHNQKVVAGLHTFLARPNKIKIYLGFSGHLVKAEYVRKQIMTIAQGTKVLSLSTGRLAGVKLNIPCFDEQAKIAQFLTSLDVKIKKLDLQISLAASFKKGLLQKMFI